MKRYFSFALYLETGITGTDGAIPSLPKHQELGERLAAELMRALPMRLLQENGYSVRLECAEVIYRGHRVAQARPRDATRRDTFSRRLLPG